MSTKVLQTITSKGKTKLSSRSFRTVNCSSQFNSVLSAFSSHWPWRTHFLLSYYLYSKNIFIVNEMHSQLSNLSLCPCFMVFRVFLFSIQLSTWMYSIVTWGVISNVGLWVKENIQAKDTWNQHVHFQMKSTKCGNIVLNEYKKKGNIPQKILGVKLKNFMDCFRYFSCGYLFSKESFVGSVIWKSNKQSWNSLSRFPIAISNRGTGGCWNSFRKPFLFTWHYF